MFEQVISKCLADTLNVWDSRGVKSPDFNAEVEFDLDKARTHLRALLCENRQWHGFFAKNGIKPVQIYYEDAVSNYPGYLAPLLRKAGIEAECAASPRCRMQKLGNARNRVLAEVLRDMTLRDLTLNAIEMREFYRENLV